MNEALERERGGERERERRVERVDSQYSRHLKPVGVYQLYRCLDV